MTNILEFIYKYQTLLGTIIGSGLAALIAVISIRITHKNQVNLENKKSDFFQMEGHKEYIVLLISINSILINHQNLFKGWLLN